MYNLNKHSSYITFIMEKIYYKDVLCTEFCMNRLTGNVILRFDVGAEERQKIVLLPQVPLNPSTVGRGALESMRGRMARSPTEATAT